MTIQIDSIALTRVFPLLTLLSKVKNRWLQRAITLLLVILILTLILLVGIGLVLLFGWPFVLAGFWRTLRESMASIWVRGLVTALLAMVGVLLYIVRTSWRALYGAAEIVIGIAACWSGLGSSSASELSASLTVASGVYIVVRGLDNLRQGSKSSATH
jgi:hypothetical protein